MSRNPKNAPAKSKSPLPFIIIGAVLIVIVLVMPKGLLGLRRLFARPRAA